MSLKILVVDDEEQLLLLAQLKLKAEGFRVKTAMDGADALNIVNEWFPDIILADIGLPDVDGFKFFKQVRDDEQTKHIPFIIISGHDKMKDTFLLFGVEDFLTKPFTVDQLTGTVNKLKERLITEKAEQRERSENAKRLSKLMGNNQ